MKKTLVFILVALFCLPAFAEAPEAVSSATVDVTSMPVVQTHENASTLIVYFSTDDTVKAVALTAAEALDADVFEIVPEQPYTEADLAYYTDCRADREQADEAARPGVAAWPESLDQYEVVFIGYPIWHGKAPKILYTFLEGVNLSGKAIIPFCTSMSSGVGKSADELEALADQSSVWFDAIRIENHATEDQIRAWATDAMDEVDDYYNDPYEAREYADPEDFYYEYMEDFDDYEEAEEYYYEHGGF